MDNCLVSFATAAAVLSLTTLVVIWRVRERRQYPPGPMPLPVLGNLLQMRKLEALARSYGPLMYVRLGCRPAVVVSSGEAAKLFLHTHDKVFASRPCTEMAERVLYGRDAGFVMGPYGQHWREVRKLVTMQLLGSKRLPQLRAVMREEVVGMLQGLRAAAAGARGSTLDASRAVAGAVENMICRMLVGLRPSETAALHAAGSTLKDLASLFVSLLHTPVIGDYLPRLGFLDRSVKNSMDLLHLKIDLLWETVLAEREQRKRAPETPPDMLDVLMLQSFLSRDAIKTVLSDLLIAGIQSPVTTVSWAVGSLLTNPAALKKLQGELERVVGMERMVEESDLEKLPYLSATIKETLRLHPPGPLSHMSMESCQLMGYQLPKGTRAIINLREIGRDPSVWKDPHTFRPDRFIDEHPHIDMHGQHFELIPFGSGRRICPGLPLALPLLGLLVSNLVHCFHWQVQNASGSSAEARSHPPLVSSPILRVKNSFLSTSLA